MSEERQWRREVASTKVQVRWPTILLLEHGDTDFTGVGDADQIHGTKHDRPLIAKGRRQAELAAEKIADYDVASLEHSPMLRSKQTAEYVEKATGVKAVPNEALLPWDSGVISGMTHGAAKEWIAYYVKNPGKVIREGEAYGDWWDKFSKGLRVKMKEAEKTPGQVHVLGVHSSEVTAAPAIIKGDPAQVLNERLPGSGQIAALEKKGGRWRFIPRFA